jgi:phosphatidate cytidylyltransferase
MKLPDEIWLQMFIIVGAVLVFWLIPVTIATLFRKLRHKEVRSLWVRYGAWFIMVPVFIIPMLIGKIYMQVFLLILSLVAFEEFSRAVGLRKEPAQMWLGRFSIIALYVPVFFAKFGIFMSMPAYTILLAFLVPILRDKFEGMVQLICLTILGIIYFGWFLAHLAFLLNVETGRQLILVFMLVVVTNDASAYIIGSNLGRHHITPHISPNKTWEGTIGALIVTMAVLFGVRFALLGISIKHTLILGFLVSLGGTCGDLAISVIKRDVHIKDMGTLIPGHGGLLDRLDSILFTAPIFFQFMVGFYINEIGSFPF